MKQVEFKIKNVRREKMLPTLKAFGGTVSFEGDIITSYYDNREAGFVASGKRLSMRTKGSKTLLTFKNKYNDLEVSVSDEYEIDVSDSIAMEHMLQGMGYTPFVKFHKSRMDLVIDDVTFSFDKYMGEFSYIPEFMTIESNNEAIILYWADELKIDRKVLESISVLDMIKEYKNKRNYEATLNV